MQVNLNRDLINKTKGFLNEEEGEALYDYALKASQRGPCLEIGSYCGKSTIYLGSACKETGGTLFSIDHHHGSEEQQPGEEYFDPDLFDENTGRVDTFKNFRKTLEQTELEETVVPIVSRSDLAARQWATPLSLVFIDGGHSYEAVHTDYQCWTKHLLPQGYLLIHDIFKNPDEGGQAPYEVYKLALESGLYSELPMIKTLGVLQRKT